MSRALAPRRAWRAAVCHNRRPPARGLTFDPGGIVECACRKPCACCAPHAACLVLLLVLVAEIGRVAARLALYVVAHLFRVGWAAVRASLLGGDGRATWQESALRQEAG